MSSEEKKVHFGQYCFIWASGLQEMAGFVRDIRSDLTTDNIEVVKESLADLEGSIVKLEQLIRQTSRESSDVGALVDAGVPLEDVQTMLGHADLKTTSRYMKRGQD